MLKVIVSVRGNNHPQGGEYVYGISFTLPELLKLLEVALRAFKWRVGWEVWALFYRILEPITRPGSLPPLSSGARMGAVTAGRTQTLEPITNSPRPTPQAYDGEMGG